MPDRLTLEELEADAAAFDRSVAATAGIDPFCSRTEWILPFHRAFLAERELHLYREGDAFLALAAREHPAAGVFLEPLENMWCFACPLVGPESPGLLREVASRVEAATGRRPPMVLAGIPLRGTLARALIDSLDVRYALRVVDVTLRFVAALEGGFESWLGRRSASFRRNLRSAVRMAEREAVTFEALDVPDARHAAPLYDRILAIEEKSWKSAAGVGVDEGNMLAFYRDMVPRLAARGGLRVVIARQDEEDVGYVYGSVVADHFRGLQMSSDHRLRRLSLGNLLQRAMIERLCAEGIGSYDLGSQSDYKRRWAEEGLKTVTVLCRPK
jgi:CelD/BcsL family acetyltransferase involved in cellulose biosynthesis